MLGWEIILWPLELGDGAVLEDSTSPQACGWTTHIKQVDCKDMMMQIVTTWQIMILRSVEAGNRADKTGRYLQ